MRKYIKSTLIILVAAFVIIQFFPVNRPEDHPPKDYNFFKANNVPPDIEILVRDACFDCHSQETVYPWYVHIAPVSWLLASDVREGRHHLDFSTWNEYDKRKKINVLSNISDEVKSGDMPFWMYPIMHPKARLSDADRKKIVDWADAMGENEFNK